MNQAFKQIVDYYKPVPVFAHNVQMMRLYRRCLRTINSWAEDREVFNIEATKVREEFNANMKVPLDSALLKRIVREANERLAAQTHPDPYIVNYMPGGSLFMRNSPPPLEMVFPDGIPEGVSRRRVNIDYSNVPDDQPYADKVFVDSVNKLYWIDR